MKAILILDMSFTLKMIRERQLEQVLESYKLGGYFGKVILVHPLAGLFELNDKRWGEPKVTQVDGSLVFVEGKIGINRGLCFLPPLNLLLAQVRLVRSLLKMARECKVDVVRIGDPYYLGLMGVLLIKFLRVPLVIRVCFRYDEFFRVTGKPVMPRLFVFRWVEKIVERFVFKRCDLIAGANEDNMNYALENGGRPDTATVFRYGNLIHPDHWKDPGTRLMSEEQLNDLGIKDEKVLVTVARLEPMKYVEDVVRVVADLIRRGHKVKGLIIGDGTLKEELRVLVEKLGVKNEVIFAGNRSQEWIAAVLPRAAVIISPHMGRALTEAALAGVAIVAYDYDWQREVIIDGQTGYLVPHKNWMMLADKAEDILIHPDIGRDMGGKVRERILNMMDPQKLTLHEQNEYSELFKRFL